MAQIIKGFRILNDKQNMLKKTPEIDHRLYLDSILGYPEPYKELYKILQNMFCKICFCEQKKHQLNTE